MARQVRGIAMRRCWRRRCKARGQMRGFITERDFEQAELEFPGIRAVFEACPEKPRTFIELLARYLLVHGHGKAPTSQAA